MANSYLKVRGAREHNLKNVNVDIPKNKLVVFTGLSGSGKSSLAFDTIYAEGQRRYVESLSSYARQFLGVMSKPDVDLIEGLSPAISIDQKAISANPRSTVGTITEIYDYLRLLFARIGHPHCPTCGKEIAQLGSQQIAEAALSLLKTAARTRKQARFMLLAPLVRERKGEYSDLFENLQKKGFTRARIDGQIFSLDEDFILIKTNKHTIEAVVDRITVENSQFKDTEETGKFVTRLTDSVEHALKLSDGTVIVSQILDADFAFPEKPKQFKDHLFSQKFACPTCNLSIAEIEPRSFSFNTPFGACQTCSGIGTLLKIDASLLVNPRLTILEGGILPFARLVSHDTWFMRLLKTVALEYGINLRAPLGKLTPEQKDILLFGTGDKSYDVTGENRFGKMTTIEESWPGVTREIEKRYGESESDFVKREIEKYMRKETCPVCLGSRLKKESLSVTIDLKSIADVSALAITDAQRWIKSLLNLTNRESIIATPIVKEISSRLTFLVSVGLTYLTLDRAAESLSGGEAQRIRLASQIGSGLSGVLYVLDEPTMGLHQRDNDKLIATLKELRDLENSVIVVEHDRDMMENADYLLDFGPCGGEGGGHLVSQGTIEEIKKDPKSLTGRYLTDKEKIEVLPSLQRITAPATNLILKGCKEHNLKNIDVTFPLGKFICITGVSGSGKSTLIDETLYHALAGKLRRTHRIKPGKHDGLFGSDEVNKVLMIDQSPIGRTPRSNPATYTGLFGFIRDLYSQTPEARLRGYKLGRFSFNVSGGRCENCEGEGEIKIEMQFLPPVYVACEVCNGSRYNSQTLEVQYKNKNIAEVLNMTVEEALGFLGNIPGLYRRLETLSDVGLGYIKLGQPAPTLSGGEAQRIKLASELGKQATGNTVYILDEPTVGLHFADLKKLLIILRRLVDVGNTVITIEHNLDVIKNADWVIDLGPEGGEKGGEVVAVGTPQEIAEVRKSYTGQFLKKII